MPQFPVVDGQIYVGGVALSRLATRVGKTPFYVYSRAAIMDRVKLLRTVLPPEIELHYAMKANPMPALVQFMVPLVDGFDVASAGEMAVALNAGVPADAISIAGPGKTDDELRRCVAAGILVNVESARELACITDTGESLGIRPRVAVRVNPDFELKSSGMKMGGGPKQFGIDVEAVPALLAEIHQRDLDFIGFHIFSGSQNLRAEAICEAQTKSLNLAMRLSEQVRSQMRLLNLGGGFGIPYFPGEERLDLSRIGTHLHGISAEARRALPGVSLALELGRYLVGEAGLYVCRVIDRKVSRGEIFLVTDGGLHQHLAASGNFGQVIRKNFPVSVGTRMGTPDSETVSVVGPLCTPLDILADRMELPVASIGDLIVVFQSGAYGLTASPTAFLSHPQPAEILV